jgi:glycosyltransferase involved in cell wall biosynthesis
MPSVLTAQTGHMGTRSPAISVVIPTFNRATMLGATLESLAAQSIPKHRYEVPVVDDGSKDSTGEVCRELASRIRLRYLIYQLTQKWLSWTKAMAARCSWMDVSNGISRNRRKARLKNYSPLARREVPKD